jgi:hypothetical protein
MKRGRGFRARCPAHDGDSPDTLSIIEGRDRDGNPCTLLHCFAHNCDVKEICAALGIGVANLFVIHPDYARETRNQERSRTPAIAHLRTIQNATPDDLAAIMLEDFIYSDLSFIETCEDARRKLWELAQEPPRRERFTRAFESRHLNADRFWEMLRGEMEGGRA